MLVWFPLTAVKSLLLRLLIDDCHNKITGNCQRLKQAFEWAKYWLPCVYWKTQPYTNLCTCGACAPIRMHICYCSLPFPLVYISACVWLFPANRTLTQWWFDVGPESQTAANNKTPSGQHHIFTRLYRPATQIWSSKLKSNILLIGLHRVFMVGGNACLLRITRHFSECTWMFVLAVLYANLSRLYCRLTLGIIPQLIGN